MRVLPWLLLAACNGLFGLDPTIDDSVDTDHDGVLDTVDNCRGISNPLQTDGNGNGVGDECDLCGAEILACVTGVPINVDHNANCIDDGCERCEDITPNDEDGDGILDGCDLCPPLPDAEQLDGDGDGVSDACDVGDAQQHRLFFDGFHGTGEVDRTLWDGDWILDNGVIRATAAPLAAARRITGAGATGDWSILIAFDPGFESEIAIQIAPKAMPSPFSSCTLTRDDDTKMLVLVARSADGIHKSGPVPFAAPITPMAMRLLFESEGGPGLRCELVGLGISTNHVIDATSGQPELGITLAGGRNAVFHYAFVVD